MPEESFYIVHGALDRNVDLLKLSGKLTDAGCNQLVEAINEASATRKRAVTLDFSGVTFMTGSALFPLYIAATRAKRGGVRLFAVGLDEPKQSALRAARLDVSMVLVRALSEARMMAHQE